MTVTTFIKFFHHIVKLFLFLLLAIIDLFAMPGIQNLGNTCYVNATVQLINRIKSLRKGIIEDSSIASTLVPHAPPEIRDETLEALTSAQSRRVAIQQWQLQDRCMVRDALKNLLEKLGRKELSAVNPRKFCRLLRCKGNNHAKA